MSSDPVGSPRVLAVIPARGGSKGVPFKNIRLLGGKPLLAYTAQAAASSSLLWKAVLTTDDEGIAEVGRSLGLEVPFLRPPELARDDTPTLPVVQHAVAWVEAAGERVDAVCLLQPTTPFRRPGVIDRCIQALAEGRGDSIVTMLPVPAEYNPHWVYFQGADGVMRISTGESSPIPRRQLLPRAFHRDGSIYLVRRDTLMIHNSLYGQRVFGVESDPAGHVNIDTLDDWVEAERILAQSPGLMS